MIVIDHQEKGADLPRVFFERFFLCVSLPFASLLSWLWPVSLLSF
jgi:hypothetical protein